MLDSKTRQDVEAANTHLDELIFNQGTDMETGEPIETDLLINCGCDATEDDLAMVPPVLFEPVDGPALASNAAALYNMVPPAMNRLVANNVSPGLKTWIFQAESSAPQGGEMTNPAGTYSSPPRVIHSVSELLGGEPEGEEVDEEENDIVEGYFGSNPKKRPIQRQPGDSNLTPRTKKLSRQGDLGSRYDLTGTSRDL
jgi:hypothetical protein